MSVTIFLVEEYGYRYWLWETGMDADALIVWWSELPTVDKYFFDRVGFRVSLRPCTISQKVLTRLRLSLLTRH